MRATVDGGFAQRGIRVTSPGELRANQEKMTHID
jgi:hypothetical protein